ncbi:hypothetical protein BH24ACT15_BH24ACT15_31170 [soil metagenome]
MAEVASADTHPHTDAKNTLVIRYLCGRVHANPWDRHPNEAAVEWPPSPWRVFRALYSVWKERAIELETADVEGMLTALASHPPTYRLHTAAHGHTRHWYPTEKHRSDPNGYKKSLALDAFMAVDQATPAHMIFPVSLEPAQATALDVLCHRLTYLGRAESCVEVSVDRGSSSGSRASYIECRPAGADHSLAEEGVRLLVPDAPLNLQALATGTKQIQKRRLTLPPGTHQIAYTAPTQPPVPPRPGSPPRRTVTAVLWHLTAPALPSVQAAVLQGEALHTQIGYEFGRLTNKGHSRVLSGKDTGGRPLRNDHSHAHVLHYDLDGDGLLDTALLWAPEGLDDSELQAAVRSVHVTPRDWLRDFRPVQFGLEYVGDIQGLPAEIVGPSRQWTSITPFAPPHHPKRRQRDGAGWHSFIEAQVHKACSWHGLPNPDSVEVLERERPWLDYRRYRGKEKLRDARRAVGITVTFPMGIEGPLALGALSHFGLGLFRPFQETNVLEPPSIV